MQIIMQYDDEGTYDRMEVRSVGVVKRDGGETIEMVVWHEDTDEEFHLHLGFDGRWHDPDGVEDIVVMRCGDEA